MNDLDDGEDWLPFADRSVMRRHLEWLRDSMCAMNPDLRLEIAWGNPEHGPNRAKTFRLDKIGDAVGFAAWINSKGCNVYVGVTLKCGDTPAKGRTQSRHAALATGLPIDIDGDFITGARKLAAIAKPQLLVVTGYTPELRGQLWLRITATKDMNLWNELNRRSVCLCGGDRNALGTYRLMRLAGSVSYPSRQKRARGYVIESTCMHFVNGPAHELGELLDRFPSAAFEHMRDQSNKDKSGGRDEVGLGSNVYERLPLNRTNVALVKSILDALPPEYVNEFDLWLRVGFSLHDFDAGDFGLALWKRFSKRCPAKADNTDFDTRWAALNRDYEGRKITIGWIRGCAQAHGWRAPCRWDRSTKIAS